MSLLSSFQLFWLVLFQFTVQAYYVPVYIGSYYRRNGEKIVQKGPSHLKENIPLTVLSATKRKFSSSSKSSNQFADNLKFLETLLAFCRSLKIKKKNDVPPPDISTLNQAINIAGKLNRPEDGVEIFQTFSKIDLIPDIFTFNYLIWGFSNIGRMDRALYYFQRIENANLRPNVYSYGALMHGYAKLKDSSHAIQLLQKMEDQGIIPNRVILTSTILACTESQEYSIVLMILKRMNSLNIEPDQMMLNAVIKISCSVGKMKDAEHFFRELQKYGEADVVTYHTLMYGYFLRGNYPRVLQLYQEALINEIDVDEGIFAIAINAAGQERDYSKVITIALEANNRKIKLTAQSYTLLIKAYYEKGGIDQALSLLKTMQTQGVQLNEYSYSAIIAACRSRPSTVIELLDKMKEEAITPNEVVLTAAIDALATSPSPEYFNYAYEIYQEMEKNGPRPNLFTYNSLVRLFAQAGKMEEALEILKKIKMNRFQPDYHTYTSLIVACGNTNRTDMMDEIINTMKLNNLYPDEISYSAMLEAYRKTKNLSKSILIIKEMLKLNQIEPTSSHYNIIMKTFKEMGKIDELKLFINKLSQRHPIVDFNSNTFDLILEAFLEQKRWKDILQIMELMTKVFHIKPSLKVCVDVIDLLEKQRQYKLVFQLYRYMIKQGYDFYENRLLNDVFKRLIQVTGIGMKESSLSPSKMKALEGESNNENSSSVMKTEDLSREFIWTNDDEDIMKRLSSNSSSSSSGLSSSNRSFNDEVDGITLPHFSST